MVVVIGGMIKMVSYVNVELGESDVTPIPINHVNSCEKYCVRSILFGKLSMSSKVASPSLVSSRSTRFTFNYQSNIHIIRKL